MQKWEYKSMFLDTEGDKLYIDGEVVAEKNYRISNYLQQLGDEGWELAGVVSECYANGSYLEKRWTGIKYYFKRPKP
jgi:hypothetical protein